MADNVSIDPGTTTPIATDDVSGVQYQKIKVDIGGDGASVPVDGGQEAMAASIPVVVASDQSAIAVDGSAVTQPVSAAALPLPSGAATAAAQATLLTELQAKADLAETQPVSAATLPLPTGAATEASLATVAGAVSGTEMQADVLTVPAPLSTTGGGTEAAALRVTIANDSTGLVSVDDGGGALTIDAAALPLPTGAATEASLATVAGAVTGSEMQVDVVAALPAGTNAIGKLAANSGVDIGDVDVLTLPGVAGDVAHDGADSGNPLKLGAKALAHGSNPTAVAAADRTDLYANRAGVLWTIGGHPNTQTVRANYATAQTDAAVVTVAGGLKIVVTRVTATLDKACSVDVQVRIGFAAATTPTTTDVVATHPGIAAGGGFTIGNGGGVLGIGADGEDLRITSEVPTGGSLDVCVSYYTIES